MSSEHIDSFSLRFSLLFFLSSTLLNSTRIHRYPVPQEARYRDMYDNAVHAQGAMGASSKPPSWERSSRKVTMKPSMNLEQSHFMHIFSPNRPSFLTAASYSLTKSSSHRPQDTLLFEQSTLTRSPPGHLSNCLTREKVHACQAADLGKCTILIWLVATTFHFGGHVRPDIESRNRYSVQIHGHTSGRWGGLRS